MRYPRSVVVFILMLFLFTPQVVPAETISEHRFIKLDENARELPDAAAEWVMVKDTVSGLIWEVKTDDDSVHDMDNLFSWKKSKSLFINKLNTEKFGGFSDWRLPEEDELTSILDRDKDAPYINEKYFPNTLPELYMGWALCGDGVSINSSKIHFGDPPKQKKKKKKRQIRVRAVRGKMSGQ